MHARSTLHRDVSRKKKVGFPGAWDYHGSPEVAVPQRDARTQLREGLSKAEDPGSHFQSMGRQGRRADIAGSFVAAPQTQTFPGVGRG